MESINFALQFPVHGPQGMEALEQMTNVRQAIDSKCEAVPIKSHLLFCQNLCRWAEAVYRTPSVHSRVRPLCFRYPLLRLSCDCIWSDVLVQCVRLGMRILIFSREAERGNSIGCPHTGHVERGSRISLAPTLAQTLGLLTYVRDRALVVWTDADLSRFRLSRFTLEQIIHYMRGYALWNAAHLKYYAAIDPVNLAAPVMDHLVSLELDNIDNLDESSVCLTVVNPDLMRQAAELFFTCYTHMRDVACSEKLKLSWEDNNGGSIKPYCQKHISLEWETRDPPFMAQQRDVMRRPWYDLALTEWIIATGRYQLALGESGSAVACYRVARKAHAYIADSDAVERDHTQIHGGPLPRDITKIVRGLRVYDSVLKNGTLPVDWRDKDSIEANCFNVFDFATDPSDSGNKPATS